MNFIPKWLNENIILKDDTITFPEQEDVWFYNEANKKLPFLNKYVFINYDENQNAVGVYFTGYEKWGDKLLKVIKEIFYKEMIKDFL